MAINMSVLAFLLCGDPLGGGGVRGTGPWSPETLEPHRGQNVDADNT